MAVLILAFLGFNYFKGNDCNLQGTIDKQQNQITLLEAEKGNLSKTMQAFKSAPIVIVVTSSQPTLLKQVLIQYNSKKSHGPKRQSGKATYLKLIRTT